MRFVSTLSSASRRNNRGASGFTLTELTIVLGIAGIVLAALWATVGPVYETIKKERATELIAATVNNIRSYYMGQIGMTNAGDQTDLLLRRVVMPPETIQNKKATVLAALNPWGGAFQVFPEPSPPPAIGAQAFRISYQGLPISACIALASYYAGATTPPDLLDIRVNGASLAARTTQAAMAACTANNAQLDLVYRLRQQS